MNFGFRNIKKNNRAMFNVMRMKKAILPLLMLLSVSMLSAQNCDPQNWENSDEDKCKQALSVFHSDVKQGNYEGAYSHWRYYYCNCPKEDGAQKWVYIDGAKILVDYMKQNKKDKPKLEAYYDTLMMVYDNWVINYQEEGKVAGYKGLYTYAYQNYSLDRLVETKDYFEKSIEIEKNDVTYNTINYYMTVLQKLSKYKKIDTAYWVDKYFVTSDIIDANLSDSGRYFEKWTKTREDIDNMMAPVLTCEQLLPIYENKLKNDPSVDDLTKMVIFMERKGCTDSKTYEVAASTLCDKEPSATCKAALAQLAYKNGRYNDAIALFKEAITLQEDGMLKANYHLGIADCYVKLGSTQNAMTATNSALALNPNFGKAYMLKGSLYATLAKDCKDFDAKAAYWVVVDQFVKAKSVDASLSDICNSRIASYSNYFPTTGEIFFKALNIGDSYRVECLGVSSTIRAKAE